MTQKLLGKVAAVTGAGSGGIGGEVALALAAEGAKVVVNDIARNSSGVSLADIVVKEIIKAKGTAVANYDSVATMQGGENIIKTAISNFGRIDILVNCAGNVVFGSSHEISEEQWDSVLNVHLKGHFSCVRAALPEMMRQRSGRIINFSSTAAAFGGGSLPYSTAKAGILGLTSSLSTDYKEYGITVNAILPAAVTKLFPEKDKTGLGLMLNNLPVSPDLGPDYVAPIVVYLATEEAKNITGRLIGAYGGYLCIYAKPFQLPGEAHILIHKMGKWTVDELGTIIPSLLK
jgi:NAD(P)-dependent dehydrogenase (short-subunit alcohol dehydrogenase family)